MGLLRGYEGVVGEDVEIEGFEQLADFSADHTEGDDADVGLVSAGDGLMLPAFVAVLFEVEEMAVAGFETEEDLGKGVFGDRDGVGAPSGADGDITLPEGVGGNATDGAGCIEDDFEVGRGVEELLVERGGAPAGEKDFDRLEDGKIGLDLCGS